MVCIMLLKSLAAAFALVCVSCVAPGPRTYRYQASEFTLPEGWVEGVSPKPDAFVAVRDEGDPVELFTVVAKPNPSPGLAMSPQDWKRLFEDVSEVMTGGLRSQATVSNLRRVEWKIEQASPKPRLWSRYVFDCELAGQPVKASFSYCLIVTDRMIYSVGLRERRSDHAADPGRFERLVATLRTRP